MIIVIHQSNDTRNAFLYNETKVKEGAATYFHSANTLSVNPFLYGQWHRWKILNDIEKENQRVKKKCLHVSVNPSSSDILKLDDKTIRQEIDRMMGHMGYGNQPYFVYKHQDLERIHFHVVSTRIDKATGKKIRDGYEKDKMQKFVKDLEQKYQLKQEIPKELMNLKFTASSGNLTQNLESLFGQLNRMEFIASQEMYNMALELFNVEVRKAGRGHLVFVTDEQGNPIRHPVRMSDFAERPKFYLSKQESLAHDQNKKSSSQTITNRNKNGIAISTLKSLIVKELIWQIQDQMNDGTLGQGKKYRMKAHPKKRKKGRHL
ncbi:MAG: relaxase/mobilization nuclease domain-containing protein [Prolixibacteraceae bacterium]|jgi:hypothetical protein|nr:relaxase/mobilization nuclease domain-containing protein [Prolixibacteraceae bacterium]